MASCRDAYGQLTSSHHNLETSGWASVGVFYTRVWTRYRVSDLTPPTHVQQRHKLQSVILSLKANIYCPKVQWCPDGFTRRIVS